MISACSWAWIFAKPVAGAAHEIEVAPEPLPSLGERARPEIGTARDDDARGLAAGVRVDDLNFVHDERQERAAGDGAPIPPIPIQF